MVKTIFMNKSASGMVVAVLLGAGMASMAQGSAQAQAGQMERPVLLLQCADATGPICRAVFQALAKVAPRHALRINPAAPVPDAISITLDLDGTDDVLSGSLHWQVGQGAMTHGPVHTSGDMPSGSNHVPEPAARRFAEDLVQFTPDLGATLARRTRA